MTEKSKSQENTEEPAEKKHSGKSLKILLLLSAVLLMGVAAGWSWYKWAQGPLDASAATVSFRVPKGASSSKVGKMLHKRGLIRSSLAWRLFLKFNKAPAPKAGIHDISAAMNFPQLLAALSSKPIAEDVSITMVEGWRIRDADKILSSKGLFSPGAYIEAASHPEKYTIPFPLEGKTLAGYLLPNTYKVPAPGGKVDISRLVQIQLNAFFNSFYKPNEKEIKASGRTLKEIVIMASLLEREEPDPKMRPMVAGVLYKRLDSKTPLGVDATSRFSLDDWNDRRKFLAKLRDPSDPYNTRLKRGLPPGPIGAPSLDSLLAALRPKKSAYWYYLHDKHQKIHFARNAAQHEANRKKYAVW